MHRFLLIGLAVYVIIFASCLVYTLEDHGAMFLMPALSAVVLSEPWIAIIGSFVGDKMSYPDKLNSAIDDDSFSKVGMLVLAISGIINVSIVGALSLVFKKLSQARQH